MYTTIKQKNKGFTRTLKFSVTPKGGGFTLVETLVAISIFTVSILGMMSVLASSISNTSYVKQKITATYLAQEGIECIRNIRDNYILDGTGWSAFKVIPNFNVISPCSDPNPSSGFTRTLSKNTNFGTDEVKITSIVSWNQGSGIYNVTFSENLFNWY